MMMKFAIIFLVSIFISSCCEDCKYEEWISGQVTEKYRFNTVGIIGEKSDTAYIEVWYSEATEDEKNKVVYKWVKPPITIGGHYSNVTYNRLTSNRKEYDEMKQMVVDYSEGGSHYMKIVNHGDKPIEYFIAGTHPIKTLHLDGHYDGKYENGKTSPSNIHTYSYPRVLYNKVPVHYLLYPSEKPKEDYYEFNVDYLGSSYKLHNEKYEILNFSFQEDWTLEKIMNLYRKEYKNHDGTLILKFPVEDYSSGNNNYWLSKGKKLYYGFIQTSDSIISNEKTAFITESCGDIGRTGYKCTGTEGQY